MNGFDLRRPEPLSAAVLVSLLIPWLVACTPASEPTTTTATLSLPAPIAATTVPDPSPVPSSSTTSAPPGRLLLAPGWEVVGDGDRIGGLMFGTGDELIVWGGSSLPVGFDPPPNLFNGVIWSHDSGALRALPALPFPGCSGLSSASWTGVELVVWVRPNADLGCAGGGVAAYDPDTDVWRTVDAPEFLVAGMSAVWTGDEILAWRQGLALDPSTGAVRQVEPLEIGEGRNSSRIQAHWTGTELLVLGAASLHRYRPETDAWDRLKSPPIGVIAQASAWTGTHLLAVNYLMEAALFDPIREEWDRIESLPLRFMETIPVTFSSPELALVRMGRSMAALDGRTWVALADPVMEWTDERPYGSMVIADGWIYEVGNVVLRRPVPTVIGDGIQTERAIPLQTMLFEIPDSWTARLVPGGTSEHHTYQLDAEDGRSCTVDAHNGGEAPKTADKIPLTGWFGVEITVGMDFDANLAVVDDSDRTSDWTSIQCESSETALSLAAHIWIWP